MENPIKMDGGTTIFGNIHMNLEIGGLNFLEFLIFSEYKNPHSQPTGPSAISGLTVTGASF